MAKVATVVEKAEELEGSEPVFVRRYDIGLVYDEHVDAETGEYSGRPETLCLFYLGSEEACEANDPDCSHDGCVWSADIMGSPCWCTHHMFDPKVMKGCSWVPDDYASLIGEWPYA